ncbi:hypothetical protein B0T11DRAFT_233153, partial [Plectosphaerella cucumerina]
FLVYKKDRKIKFINLAIKVNIVTIYDSFIPLGVNKFSEDFTIYKVISLLDFFLGYN